MTREWRFILVELDSLTARRSFCNGSGAGDEPAVAHQGLFWC